MKLEYCNSCKIEVEVENEFCPYCDNKLVIIDNNDNEDTNSETDKYDLIEKRSKNNLCLYCGKTIEDSNINGFCSSNHELLYYHKDDIKREEDYEYDHFLINNLIIEEIFCENCSQKIKTSDGYCRKCDNQLTEQILQKRSEQKRCKYCGRNSFNKNYNILGKFCSEIHQKKYKKNIQILEINDFYNQNEKNNLESSSKKIDFCFKCGTDVSSKDFIYCPNCGINLQINNEKKQNNRNIKKEKTKNKSSQLYYIILAFICYIGIFLYLHFSIDKTIEGLIYENNYIVNVDSLSIPLYSPLSSDYIVAVTVSNDTKQTIVNFRINGYFWSRIQVSVSGLELMKIKLIAGKSILE